MPTHTHTQKTKNNGETYLGSINSWHRSCTRAVGKHAKSRVFQIVWGCTCRTSKWLTSLQHRNNIECPALAGSTMVRREKGTTNIEKMKQQPQMAITTRRHNTVIMMCPQVPGLCQWWALIAKESPAKENHTTKHLLLNGQNFLLKGKNYPSV